MHQEFPVPGGLPGDSVRLRVGAVKKRHGLGVSKKRGSKLRLELFGWKERLIKEGGSKRLAAGSPAIPRFTSSRDPKFGHSITSPYQVEPICPHFSKHSKSCGGCPLSHLSYPRQRIEKLRVFKRDLGDVFKRLGCRASISLQPATQLKSYERFHTVSVAKAPPSGHDLGFNDVMSETQGGEVRVGQWARGITAPGERKELVDTVGCVKATRGSKRLIDVVRKTVSQISVYDPRWNTGLLREVTVKTGKTISGSEELLLCLTVASPDKFEELKTFSEAVISECRNAGIKLLTGDHGTSSSGLAGIVVNVSRGGDRGKLLGLNPVLLAGRDYVHHGDLKIGSALTPNHQFNPDLLNFITDQVCPDQTVWDIWAGSGSVSHALESRGVRLVAIEGWKARLGDLQRNVSVKTVLVHADVSNPLSLNSLAAATHRSRALQLLLSDGEAKQIDSGLDLTGIGSRGYGRLEKFAIAAVAAVPEDVRQVLRKEGGERARIWLESWKFRDETDGKKWMAERGESLGVIESGVQDETLDGRVLKSLDEVLNSWSGVLGKEGQEEDDYVEDEESDQESVDSSDEEQQLSQGAEPGSPNQETHVDEGEQYAETSSPHNEIAPLSTHGIPLTLPPPDTVIFSFPPASHSACRKGVISKDFRRWIRANSTRRVIVVAPDGKSLRKDIGHLMMLGYGVKEIKVFDTSPHTMEMHAVAVLDLKGIS